MRYLHPDKSYAVHQILSKGRKKKAATNDQGMIERMAVQMHAERQAATGKPRGR